MAPVKHRALGFREGFSPRLTAGALHAFVCFAVFDDIALPSLSVVCTPFIPAERPGRGHFLLLHGGSELLPTKQAVKR